MFWSGSRVLLADAEFLIADGMVNGQILKEDREAAGL
jgi:hypothetical protein